MNIENLKNRVKVFLASDFEKKLCDACFHNLKDESNDLQFNNFAYSIRELSRHVLHRLGPSEEVLNCSWYRNETDKKDGITRSQRMGYAVRGGIDNNYLKNKLGINLSELNKNWKTAIQNMSKFTHIQPATFQLKDSKIIEEHVIRIIDCFEELFQYISDCRNNIIEKIENDLHFEILQKSISEHIDELGLIATHYRTDGISIDEYKITKIGLEEIEIESSGFLEVELQYGSNSDNKKGDGLRMNTSYPFESIVTQKIKYLKKPNPKVISFHVNIDEEISDEELEYLIEKEEQILINEKKEISFYKNQKSNTDSFLMKPKEEKKIVNKINMSNEKYRKVKSLNLPEIDKEILAFWNDNKIFEKSVNERSEDNSYVFYEGPPSANGKPGIHHVMARTIKDLVCRYHTLKGKRVERKGGWDTHGLPIELSVEKELGITKEDIGTKITVDEYNAKCRETVMRYKDLWDDLTIKMGYWVDLDNPYITYENEYIESVWWLLSQLYNKDLMYKGYTIQPYSPAAGTGLSTHELNQPGCYRNVKDTSAVAMFKVNRDEKSNFLFEADDEDVRIIAWTTTPWTLPSNTALTAGPKIDYVKIKMKNSYTDLPVSVVMAEALVKKWFGAKNQPEIIKQSESFKGAMMEGIRYEQLLDFGNEIEPLQGKTDAFRVILGNFVTTEDGTGIVHTAPSFGADDRMVGVQNGIGALTLVDKQGKFKDTVGEFSGRYVKNYKDNPDYVNVDIDIAIKLKKENKAFNVAKYEHNYPHCWRTDKPILYYPLDSWFIKAASVKERMSELNKTINWKPASTGEGRFGKWLENLQDWNLSRSRFWGIPLPIWRTEDGERQKCISSIEELTKEIEHANKVLGENQTVPKDLHRPYIDDVILATEDGQPMKRELDLIDVWFDSGSMPYAQWHYPFENKEKFQRNFPADFIAEGVDQTRGWFYTLHAIATMVFDNVAYKNVVSNGLVLAKNGVKMSKRLGNAVEPFEALSTYGADANRWYMIANSPPWDNLKFDIDGVDEKRKKFFGTLFNMYNFFATYANIDGFEMDETNVTPIAERPEIDKWIISKLNSLIKSYTDAMDDYEMTKACRDVENFTLNDLSNWYVRLCRRRFWKSDSDTDKQAAYETLYECMMVISQLMAPVAPFFSEWLYKNLSDPIREKAIVNDTPLKHKSVHLTYLTKVEENLIDLDLEQRMDYAQRISSLVLSIRKKENHRVRQPLQKILLPVLDTNFQEQVEAVKDLILSEVNVKEIQYLTETTGFIKKKIKPNFKTLGRKLGKNMKAAAAAIGGFSQEDIAAIEKSNSYQLVLGEDSYDLTLEDFEITSDDIPGWTVANDGALTVALDVTVTDDLLAEGTARELVNRIQNIRKTRDFNVTDKIAVTLENHEAIRPALEQFAEYICTETLATSLDAKSEVEGEMIELNDQVSLNIQVEVQS